ncbi:hypothetical protein [Ruminococcus sp.]|uniref:hypothetical protein n=1 Tax=Ruminococcus sp. TaxID=41978 RepID=UPI0025F5A730|nr:hypothetical protein [Ruminococcus sp.]MBQ8965321.1 hypothetical protein [Ruminococcus sp.]
MDILLDILEEILGALSGSRALPRPLRVILNIFYIILLTAVSLLVLAVGIYAFKLSVSLGLVCTGLGIFMLFRSMKIAVQRIRNKII